MADDLKGKAKEVAGYATGDREFEAEGKLEQLDENDTDETGGSKAEAAEAVEEAEKEVRRQHGELKDR